MFITYAFNYYNIEYVDIYAIRILSQNVQGMSIHTAEVAK